MLTDHGFVYLWKELRHVARPCLSPNPPPLHHFETCWPAECWHSLTFGCDGDGENYDHEDHTAKEEGDKDKKTKTKTTTMMMAVAMTLTRPVLLSITLKVVGQRNLGKEGLVRAPRLGISHHPGLSAGH